MSEFLSSLILGVSDSKGVCQNLSLPSFRLNRKTFSYFSTKIKCCGYSKEPAQWDGSIEHPKYMLKLLAMQKFYINLFVYLDLRSWISIKILCLLKCEMAVNLFNLKLISKQLISNFQMESFLAPF